MGVSENSGTPKSSILIGFSIINHPFWGTPIFGNTHIDSPTNVYKCIGCLGESRVYSLFTTHFFLIAENSSLQKPVVFDVSGCEDVMIFHPAGPWCRERVLNPHWLVVSTHLKNISQNGNLPQIGMKIKNI